jgi:hypothetical protein
MTPHRTFTQIGGLARHKLSATLMLWLAVVGSVPIMAQETAGTSGGQSGNANSWNTSSDGIFEIRPYAGAFIPTGPQRALLKDAVLAGSQVSVRLIPELAVTGNFAWTPNSDRLIVGAPTLDVYQYDVGLEARGAGWFLHSVCWARRRWAHVQLPQPERQLDHGCRRLWRDRRRAGLRPFWFAYRRTRLHLAVQAARGRERAHHESQRRGGPGWPADPPLIAGPAC